MFSASDRRRYLRAVQPDERTEAESRVGRTQQDRQRDLQETRRHPNQIRLLKSPNLHLCVGIRNHPFLN